MFLVCRKAKLKWGKIRSKKVIILYQEFTQERERGSKEEVLITLKTNHTVSNKTLKHGKRNILKI